MIKRRTLYKQDTAVGKLLKHMIGMLGVEVGYESMCFTSGSL